MHDMLSAYLILQVDIFNEVRILERLRLSCASTLLDYGLADDHFVLVQRRCRTSLNAWRQQQPANPHHQMQLYINIFLAVVDAVKVSLLTKLRLQEAALAKAVD